MTQAVSAFAEHGRVVESFGQTNRSTAGRLRNFGRTQRTQHVLLTDVFQDPNRIIVLGDGFRGGPNATTRGTKDGTVVTKSIRRLLSKHRKVVLADEFRTTLNCHNCGLNGKIITRLKWDDTIRQQPCPRCGQQVERDLNASKNIAAVFSAKLLTGDRPPWLSRDHPPEDGIPCGPVSLPVCAPRRPRKPPTTHP